MSTTETPNSPADAYEFQEVDGLIVSISPSQARNERDELLKINPNAQPWELEHFLNHEHLDPDLKGREELRASVAEVELLAEALRSAYPDRRFVIVNRLGAATFSFYQAVPGAATADTEPKEPLPETTYCPSCDRRERFHLRQQPDPEFPELEWADCAACRGELYIYCRSRYTLV